MDGHSKFVLHYVAWPFIIMTWHKPGVSKLCPSGHMLSTRFMVRPLRSIYAAS